MVCIIHAHLDILRSISGTVISSQRYTEFYRYSLTKLVIVELHLVHVVLVVTVEFSSVSSTKSFCIQLFNNSVVELVNVEFNTQALLEVCQRSTAQVPVPNTNHKLQIRVCLN